MILFVEVTGTQDEKPLDIDYSAGPNKVYVRKNIRRDVIYIGEDEEVEGWRYDEALMTLDEYNDYVAQQTLLQDILAGVQQIETQKAIDAYTMSLIEEGLL